MKNEEFNFTERARAINPRPDSSRPPSKSYKASRGDRAADSRPCPPQFPNGKGTARTGASSSGPPHTYDNPDGQTGHSLVPGHYPGEDYYYSPPIYNGCKFPTPYSTAESGALQVPRLTSSYDSQYGMRNSFGTHGTEMVGVVPSTGPQLLPMPAMLAPSIASPWMICQFCLSRPVVFATYPDQQRNLSPN
ncbi:uncharacterized protein BO97DRAFT_409612 [Aspergillus homomorphus CBS 101889]|uniref:Uncharacterized protein n=1 Tax=Aspergillus homomorphus (strain CBS 101889) TaxID=1450537 RepID=A0A395HF46_ASPHC|nr:hypothetical protein BO97DRAFT_409612 [Aspergillus homomorphus CBS 101889]RAL06477.1 hypothetical protein BO97DRAFT_409612 [Aspergillus homomorphus CBS 101889]